MEGDLRRILAVSPKRKTTPGSRVVGRPREIAGLSADRSRPLRRLHDRTIGPKTTEDGVGQEETGPQIAGRQGFDALVVGKRGYSDRVRQQFLPEGLGSTGNGRPERGWSAP